MNDLISASCFAGLQTSVLPSHWGLCEFTEIMGVVRPLWCLPHGQLWDLEARMNQRSPKSPGFVIVTCVPFHTPSFLAEKFSPLLDPDSIREHSGCYSHTCSPTSVPGGHLLGLRLFLSLSLSASGGFCTHHLGDANCEFL